MFLYESMNILIMDSSLECHFYLEDTPPVSVDPDPGDTQEEDYLSPTES